MLYNDVRFLMTILVLALTVWILRSITLKLARKNKLSKWYKLFNIAVIIIVFFGFSIAISWPFENLFVSFDSPEAAYRYLTDDPIIRVVDGKDTTFVAAQNGRIIPKVYETKDNVVRWKRLRQTQQAFNSNMLSIIFQYSFTITKGLLSIILTLSFGARSPFRFRIRWHLNLYFPKRRFHRLTKNLSSVLLIFQTRPKTIG